MIIAIPGASTGTINFWVTPKFTLTEGLRYELNIPIYTPNPNVNPCCQVYNAAAGQQSRHHGDSGIVSQECHSNLFSEGSQGGVAPTRQHRLQS